MPYVLILLIVLDKEKAGKGYQMPYESKAFDTLSSIILSHHKTTT